MTAQDPRVTILTITVAVQMKQSQAKEAGDDAQIFIKEWAQDNVRRLIDDEFTDYCADIELSSCGVLGDALSIDNTIFDVTVEEHLL